MISKKEPEQKQGGTKRILAAIAIIAAALFILVAAAPAAAPENSVQPAASVSNYTPTPTMNTNVTWSSFNSSWGELEYFNGTSQANLTASPNPAVTNPISIDTSDIQSSQLETFANWTKNTGTNAASGGQVKTLTNTSTSVTETVNTTAAQSTINELTLNIPIGKIPSANLNFTYLTIAYSVSGTNLTGEQAYLSLWNTTGTSTKAANSTIYGSGTAYKSISLWQIIKNGNPKITMNYDTGTLITTGIYQNLPAANSTTYTLKITALDLTTYPIILGQNSTGATITSAIDGAKLTSFNPTDKMLITNDGYTVSVQQNMQNVTEQQTSINAGSYTEQATYQGIFEMPTAPDLIYSATNITLPLTISGAQYEVANLNGASYLSSIQKQKNGTFSFGSVNPNSQNSLVLEVEYTTAQWDASSSAPSFFTLAGIEYYWWVAVLGLMGLIGLGSLAISHFGGEKETLRIPKGKFGR